MESAKRTTEPHGVRGPVRETGVKNQEPDGRRGGEGIGIWGKARGEGSP